MTSRIFYHTTNIRSVISILWTKKYIYDATPADRCLCMTESFQPYLPEAHSKGAALVLDWREQVGFAAPEDSLRNLSPGTIVEQFHPGGLRNSTWRYILLPSEQGITFSRVRLPLERPDGTQLPWLFRVGAVALMWLLTHWSRRVTVMLVPPVR